MSTMASTTVSIAFSPVWEARERSSSSVIIRPTLPGIRFGRLVNGVTRAGEPLPGRQYPGQPGGEDHHADRDDRVVEVGPLDRARRGQHEQHGDDGDPDDRGPADQRAPPAEVPRAGPEVRVA